MSEQRLDAAVEKSEQVILPRKAVLELMRLLDGDGEVALSLGTNHLRVQLGPIRFTSKLIDGRFPEYGRVIPADVSKVITVDRGVMRTSLQRAAILSNEKYRGIRLDIGKDHTVTICRPTIPSRKRPRTKLEVEYRR